MRWGDILVLFLGILIGWAGMYLFYEKHYGNLLKECNETLYEYRGDNTLVGNNYQKGDKK